LNPKGVPFFHHPAKMQLFVGSHVFEATASTSVEDLKVFVEQVEGTLSCRTCRLPVRLPVRLPASAMPPFHFSGIPAEAQYLLCCGRPLESGSLVEAGVTALTTIQVGVRLLGGKVHGSLARAGKVRGQTPKVAKQDKKKLLTGACVGSGARFP
jgi:small subunit ribosomal protein S30e